MGKLINKKVVVDSETGEIVKEKSWVGYDGFTEKGYQYRRKAIHIRYYFDALPSNLSESAFLLLIEIAELMNEQNVLVTRVKRKSKFSSIVNIPLTKEEIQERIRFKMGKNKFDASWKELSKHCIKKIKYYENMVWAVNPAVISKCKEVPLWLYDEFKDSMNPFLTAITIRKFNTKIDNQFN